MTHTLLLADDSVTIQRVIELTFADEDVRVVAVGDGDQAIAALEETAPDIVLADVGMPGRDGYDVARHIRSTPHLAHIPVLLLTGAFEPIDRERAAASGCDGVLAKPFEPHMVIGRVKDLLSRPKNPASAEDTTEMDAFLPTPSTLSAPFTDPAGAMSAYVPEPAKDVEQYFDRLDRAFATLSDAVREHPKPAPATPVPPVPSAGMPPLAEAFAALLAAERSLPVSPSAWPLEAPPVTIPEVVISEGVIEDIVARVLGRLSERVVRETVGEIVSGVAERLVREEIERIRKTGR